MIKSKEDLKYYLEADKKALRKNYSKPRFIHDIIWQFEILIKNINIIKIVRLMFLINH